MIENNIVPVLCFMTIGNFHQGIAAPNAEGIVCQSGLFRGRDPGLVLHGDYKRCRVLLKICEEKNYQVT